MDARERGELRVDVDPTIFVEMLGGAAILHTLMHREDGLDEAWGAQMLAALSAIVVDEHRRSEQPQRLVTSTGSLGPTPVPPIDPAIRWAHL